MTLALWACLLAVVAGAEVALDGTPSETPSDLPEIQLAACEAARGSRSSSGNSSETVGRLTECLTSLRALSARLALAREHAVAASEQYKSELQSLDGIVGKFTDLRKQQGALFEGFHRDQSDSLAELMQHVEAARTTDKSAAYSVARSNSSLVFALVGQGYCGASVKAETLSSTASCKSFDHCISGCRGNDACRGFAWSQSPVDNVDGCQKARQPRCIHYSGLVRVDAILANQLRPEYMCYSKNQAAKTSATTAATEWKAIEAAKTSATIAATEWKPIAVAG